MIRQMLKALVLFCVAGSLFNSTTAIATQTYTVVSLGSLGGEDTTGYAINSAGEVVGDSIVGGVFHAFKYSSGVMLDLGLLSGYSNSFGRGINASGQVTGFGGTDNVGSDGHAYLYSNGTMTDLGTLGGPDSFGYAINSIGQVTGSSDTSPNNFAGHAFVYSNGVMTDLNGVLGGSDSQGNSINDNGAIAGSLAKAGTSSVAFLYSNGAVSNPASLGGSGSWGFAINNSGVLAGEGVPDSGGPHAILFSNGVTTDLGILPGGMSSIAYGINTGGQVVGYADAPSPHGGAFIYTNGTMMDLTTLINVADPLFNVVKFMGARAINDNGWIVVNGLKDNIPAAYLLLPTWLSLTPTTLLFGNQQIGTTSTTQAVAVTNTGSASAALSFAVSGPFTQTNDCGTSLTGGATCSVQVGFAPAAIDPGTVGGTLTITPAAAGPLVVSLSGTGETSVSISTSASTVTAGVAVTLTWSSTAGAVCTASGGSTADGWTGIVPASGSKPVTETTAGSYTYGLSCVDGAETVSADKVVTVTVPSVSLSASPTNLVQGQATTLTWTSLNASSCSASSNGTDSWNGAKPTSGTASITESATGMITYKITCSSGPQSATASTEAFFAAKSTGGGGGALSPFLVLVLAGVSALRRFQTRRRF
jgi:probable HAF family extracellular repeat protein